MKRSAFISAVYSLVGIPNNHENIVIGIAWADSEGGLPPTPDADNNPLDTTEPAPGATDFNTAGVKNYPSWTEGVEATVETLTNGFYDALIETFKNPAANAQEKINAVNSSPWGSFISMQLYSEVLANPERFDIEVEGSPEGPPEVQTIENNAPKFEQLPHLKVGSTGHAVETLTVLLNHYGAEFTSAFDGSKQRIAIGSAFGPEVEEAVRDYQTKKEIPVTGEIDPDTWSSFIF